MRLFQQICLLHVFVSSSVANGAWSVAWDLMDRQPPRECRIFPDVSASQMSDVAIERGGTLATDKFKKKIAGVTDYIMPTYDVISISDSKGPCDERFKKSMADYLKAKKK